MLRQIGAICILFGGVAFTATSSAALDSAALDIEFKGNLEIEQRHYTKAVHHTDQEQNFTSVASELEFGLYSHSGRHAVIVKPFGRYDQHDHERSHVDLREAKYRYVRGAYEITAGADKEFWGVTEFLHLVDIINQTDNVEGIDGEQKLGQPMIKFSAAQAWGTLTTYYLPMFRIRQYVDPKTGRPSTGIVVDDNTTLFESKDKRTNEDYAIRYANAFGSFDIGLSWFDGTARAPRFIPTKRLYNAMPIMHAYYPLQTQAGLDAQATLGSWLLKLEATQSEQEKITTNRATGGVEYTFYNLLTSGTDLGLVLEYMWDERELAAPHPFGNDVGIGLRWSANDTQSTSVLLGGIIDTDTDTTAVSLEAERRIANNFKLIIEARAQDKIGKGDKLAAAVADEDFIRLRLSWYF